LSQPPVINSFISNSTNAVSDAVAIDFLLNATSALNTDPNAVYDDSVGPTTDLNGVVLSTSANKSLFIIVDNNATSSIVNVTNLNISAVNGASITDIFTIDVPASTVIRADDFQYQSISPDGGVIYDLEHGEDGYLSLNENVVSSDSLIAFDNLRVFNSTNQSSISYDSSNITQALGTEGVAFCYDYSNITSGSAFASNYVRIAGYDTLESNNISLNVDYSDNYTYQVVQINSSNSYFNFASTQVGANSQFLAAPPGTSGTLTTFNNLSNGTLYSNFVGSNYTGLLGDFISTVDSVTLAFNVTNDSANGNATCQFNNDPLDSTIIIKSGWTVMNNVTNKALLTQPNHFAEEMRVLLSPVEVTINSASQPYMTNYISGTSLTPDTDVLQTLENSTFLVGDLTLTMNSANRSTIANVGGGNVSVAVTYVSDQTPPYNYDATNYLGADGNFVNLQNQTVGRTVNMIQKATRVSAPYVDFPGTEGSLPSIFNGTGAVGNNNAGMSLYYDLNPELNVTQGNISSYISLGATNIVDSLIGALVPVDQVVLTPSQNSTNILYAETGYPNGENIILNSNNGYYPYYGTGLENSWVNDQSNRLNEIRMIIRANDPTELDGEIEQDPNEGFLNVSATTLIISQNGIRYNANAISNGPTRFKELPTSGTYYQQYEIVFPTDAETLHSSFYPEEVRVTDPNTGNTMTLQLDANNIKNRLVSTNGNVVTVTYNLEFDVALSGVVAGSITVVTPLSYQYSSQADNGSRWIYNDSGSGRPELTITIPFNSTNLVTHTVVPQYTLADDDNWADFEPPGSTLLDLRLAIYDSIAFQGVIYIPTGPTTSAPCFFRIVLKLYLLNNTTSKNIDYTVPLSYGSNIGYDLQYYRLEDLSQENLELLTNGQTLQSVMTSVNVKSIMTSELFGDVSHGEAVVTSIVGDVHTISVTAMGNSTMTINLLQAPYDAPVFFGASVKALVKIQQTIASQVQSILTAGPNIQLDSGIVLTANNLMTLSSCDSAGVVARFYLNPDLYSAVLYTGQTGQPYNSLQPIRGIAGPGQNNRIQLTPSVISLPDNNNANVAAFTTDIVRGYPSRTYTYNRGTIELNAEFGSFTDYRQIAPGSQDVTLNFGIGAGIVVTVRGAVAVDTTFTFTMNKSSVYMTYTDNGTGETRPVYNNLSTVPSTLDMATILGLEEGEDAPAFADLLYMNNFFLPKAASITLTYVQPPLVVRRSYGTAPAALYNAYASNTQLTPGTAAAFLAGRTWRAVTQTISDSDMFDGNVGQNILIDQTNLDLTFDAEKKLRTVGKSWYVTIAPVDVVVTFKNTSGSPSVFNLVLDQVQKNLAITTNNAGNPKACTYKLNVLQPFRNIAEVEGLADDTAWNYKNKLISMRGSQRGEAQWYEYFTGEDLGIPGGGQNPGGGEFGQGGLNQSHVYTYTFAQNGISDYSNVVMTWTNALTRSIYNNATGHSANYDDGWSNTLTFAPAIASQLTSYQLTYAFNTSNVLVPVVTKFVSSTTNDDVSTGVYGSTFGANGAVVHFPKGSNTGSQWVLSNSFPYPYTQVGASQYPAFVDGEPSHDNAAINLPAPTSVTAPNYLDLVIQVKDSETLNGTTNYKRWVWSAYPGFKALNVFAKDQMVIMDYAGNLAMRVGPNGRLYAGDMSAYTATYQSYLNGSQQINGPYVPVYNSNVNLTYPLNQ